MSITRQERERVVLDLYYNQGKSVREIAKEARMSFRDIGSILNKASEDNKETEQGEQHQEGAEKNQMQLSISTQAYKLFSDGKTPIEVAVALNAKESEITRFYKEYLKLDQMHDLNVVYEELKGNIIPFLKLYRLARVAGMNEQHVVNLLRIANSTDNDNDNLPAVEHRYESLKQEVNSLETRKLNSKSTLQALTKTLESCSLHHKEQIKKIADLHNKKIALEELVKRFENNNEEYLKIKQTVKHEVSSILSDGKVLLRLALYSLIESIRNDPVKYSSLFLCNNIPSTTMTNSSYMYGEQQQYLLVQDYFIEHYSAILLNEAEKLYNSLVKDLTNRITDTAFNNNSSTS
jgi:hypothetical protein